MLDTDGLTEATNARGELYTIDRLCEDIIAHRTKSPQDLADSVFQTVRAFAEGEMRDDSTILVLRLGVERLHEMPKRGSDSRV